MPKWSWWLAVFLCCVLAASGQALRIAVLPDAGVLGQPASANALRDFTQLLDSACGCITADADQSSVVMRIQAAPSGGDTVPTRFAAGRDYPYFHYPEHSFLWQAEGNDSTSRLTLSANSPVGLANGLYALLQERLGFGFVHARQTIVPRFRSWPLKGDWTWRGSPRFDKKGFHLHTMHPLELTEALHDPDFPGGLAMVREYVLWLARNGQNYFDFSLMEGVDHDLGRWVEHAAQFTRYAHDRGILCGLDLSLHMLQQKSYQLVKFPPGDFRRYEDQLRDRLRTLMRAEWDFINLEFALAEFVGGMEGLRDRLRDAVIAEMALYPGTKLVGRQHVVKPESELGGSHGSGSLNIPSDPRMGLLVHTVMCYALTDRRAPVYELHDFSHLLALLREQNAVRETWYYPESAYWVTFDNSIPLLLLPYLNARYKDIETCSALGIPGHVTFTSGWEWGYWLVDWSIARWSWNYVLEGDGAPTVARGPYQYLHEFFRSTDTRRWVSQAADLEQAWLIEGDLLRWLCPSNPTDELPPPLNKQFQPRGFANLGDLRTAAEKTPERLVELPIDSLHAFARECEVKVASLRVAAVTDPVGHPVRYFLGIELIDALQVVALRAEHSALLMEAAVAYAGSGQSMEALRAGLAKAAQVRAKALEVVRRQERRYRYPVEQVAGRYDSHTAYDFGYLYPVHDLHFWEREEQQMLRGRHGPFFRNIYDLWQIAGLR